MKLESIRGIFRVAIKNIQCGWHSGFRVCDILWYTIAWWPFGLYEGRYGKWYDKNSRSPRNEDNVVFDEKTMPQYVECPICIFLKPKVREKKNCNCAYISGNQTYIVRYAHKIIVLIDGAYQMKSGVFVQIVPEPTILEQDLGKLQVDVPYTGQDNSFQVSSVVRAINEQHAVMCARGLGFEYAHKEQKKLQETVA